MNSRRILTAARVVALATVAVMIWYFATSDALRSDNAFLVPDLLLTAFLLAAALLPRPFAEPALIFAFGWETGVYTTSLCTYIVRGEFIEGSNHIALITPALIMVTLLTHNLTKSTVRRQATSSVK